MHLIFKAAYRVLFDSGYVISKQMDMDGTKTYEVLSPFSSFKSEKVIITFDAHKRFTATFTITNTKTPVYELGTYGVSGWV